MAIEEIIGDSTSIAIDITKTIGTIGLWLKAIGVVVVIWIIVHIISWILSQRKLKTLYAMKSDIQRIEGKIDQILNKNKK